MAGAIGTTRRVTPELTVAYHRNMQMTTVHGAKNREFDHVFVIWTRKIIDDEEQKRRLLYNAITRARKDCIVLVIADMKYIADDPVLSLLGKAEPVFPPRHKKKKK